MDTISPMVAEAFHSQQIFTTIVTRRSSWRARLKGGTATPLTR